MFEGFHRHRVEVDGASLAVVTGGTGPALLLLHGFPQTHVIWHQVAPMLARDFTLVMPDLPGYGDSNGPVPDAAHRHYAKCHTARIMAGLMRELGHARFLLAGHDRGGRVGFRLALDFPDRIRAFAALDIVPTLAVWENMGWREALATYHWQFLAVPAPVPERMIGHDPDFYIDHLIERWAGDAAKLAPEARSAYRAAFRKPEVIAAACADYRAGASTDVADDRASRDAGQRIQCPVLVLWGHYLAEGVSVAEAWRPWADDIRDQSLPCGHFLAEEEPVATAAALRDFFQQVA
ncbi:haloacetate dehalogenase [Dongia mobilis]|uniref:Haloacetate dehalogenase n=1 Tax=Dongia mobilis TaxID=578943 RepID=A0A4R6WW92_9PROT|nr:alpha/beta hydrolase [Dongia mobilis]TDQ81548.1 haloacetate dehalogenase [Dongia mobilis]